MPHYILLNLNLTALGIHKNLHKKGFNLHLFHKNQTLEAFIDAENSNIFIHRLSVSEEPEQVLEKLIDIRQKSPPEPGIIFASSDADVAFIDKYRDELGKHFLLSVPSQEITGLVNDKYAFSKKLTSSGINTPRSIAVNPFNLQTEQHNISLPCLIKPVFSSEWKSKSISQILGGKKAFVINNRKEFLTTSSKLLAFSSQLLVQEIIDVPEDGNFSFCCYSDEDGNTMHGFVTQKLIQYPEGFGTALLCRVIDYPDVLEFGKHVIKTLQLDGISETEIVQDKKTGQFSVIEINTRHWMQHRLATRIGVNYSLLDFYYRTGDNIKVNELLNGAKNTGQKAIWFDDVGYLMYMVKHVFHPEKCSLKEIFLNKWEFSLFSFPNMAAFVKLFVEKIIK